MSYLLHINTALNTAFVGISRGKEVIASLQNESQKEHGSFLQPAIREIINTAGCSFPQLAAVSVINGPGSYTGLRVGLSAAKGLCYALQKPLICLSTLEWLAFPFYGADTDIICSLIDARRMEVFTASFDPRLKTLNTPGNLIIDDHSFQELGEQRIIFTGNGRDKLPERIKSHTNASLPDLAAGMAEQAIMANQAYETQDFADMAYAEPFYLKSFYTPARN